MAEVSSGQLNIHLEANAEGAASGINKLATALGTLKSNSTGMRLGTLATNLSAISAALPRNATAGSLVGLASGLRALSNVSKPQITKTHATTIAELGKAVNAIPAGAAAKLRDISTGLKTFAGMEKSNIGTLVRHIGQLPDAVDKLNKIDLSSLSGQFDRLAASMRPLAIEMEKIANGFNAMPKRLQSYINQMEKSSGVASGALAAGSASTANANALPFFKGVGGALASGIVKARILIGAMRSVGQGLSSAVRESNAYVENLNLFDVAMGEAAEGAREYAQTVQDTLGIDMSQFIRNQGIFKQILSGFGVAEERASEMSQTLTQLAYDAGSFFNLPFDTAMLKFQSGIAGELEPLRRIGYALDIATLQQYAYDAGINKTVQSMTQAEKSQIRFLAIMDQSKNIMGDLARTVHTPANAMRILGQQITLLKRAFGNVLIPILMRVIPYLNAFVQVLTAGIQALATLVGFQLPKIDYSGVASGAEAVGEVADGFGDVADGANAAGQAVKEFKNYMLGFDEMHVIPSNATENTGGGLGSVGGGLGGIGIGDGFDFDLEGYDFFAGLKDEISDIKLKIQGMVDDIWYYVEPLGGLFLSVGGFLVGAFAADKLVGLAQNVFGFSNETRGHINDVVQAIGGIAVAWYGSQMLVSQYVSGNIDDVQFFIGILGTLLTSIGMVGVAFKHLGLPVWLAALIAAGTVAISIVIHLRNENKLKAMRDVMGDIELSADEIEQLVREIIYAPWMDLAAKVTTIREEFSRLQEKIAETRHDIQLITTKIQLGIEVDPYAFETAVLDYFEDANTSLQQTLDAGLILIDLSIKDPNLKAEIQGEFGTFIGGIDSQIKQYGRDLRDLFYEGWAESRDAEQTMIDASKIVDDIQYQLNIANRIMQEGEIAGFKYRADKSLVDLDYDTYKTVITETLAAGEVAKEERIGQYQSQIGQFSVIYEDDPEKLALRTEQARKDLEYDLDQIYLSFAKVGRDTMTDLFSPYAAVLGDPNTTLPEMKRTFLNGEPNNLYDNLYGERFTTQDLFGSYMGGINNEYEGVRNAWGFQEDLLDQLGLGDEAARDIAARFGVIIKSSADLIAEDKALFDKFMGLGKRIPPELGKGLNDLAVMGALAGDYESFLHVMGMQFSSSPEVSNLLMTVNGMGAMLTPEMRRGFYSNLDLIRDENGVVTSIKNIITDQVYENTPEMQEIMKGLGVDTVTPYIEGAEEVLPEVAGVVEETKQTLYGTGSGGGGKPIEWLNTFLSELGIGLGLGKEEAGRGSSGILEEVVRFFNPTSWFGIGTESGSALGEGGASGILGWLFGLGEASSAATETVENNLGDWFGLGGSKGESLIKSASASLKDTLGVLGGAASTGFSKLRDVINGKGTDMESAMTGVTNKMKGPFNVFFADLVTNMSKSLAAVGELGIGFQFEKNTTTGGYYSVPGALIPQMYASGGYPTAGELFLMNENEPEFLTTVGGRTAVVNQDQMSKGLEAAIARGMAAANNSGGDSGDLIIQIDGRTHNLGNIAELKRKNQRAGRAVIQVN